MPSVRGFLSNLNPWHKEPELPPPLTTRTAVLLLVAYALVYFVPFYFSSWTRPSPTLNRDAPSIIRSRIASVTVSCVLCTVTTFFILVKEAKAPLPDALHLLGLWPVGFVDAAKALALTALLFLGPLVKDLYIEGGWRAWARGEPLAEVWKEWTIWRNIVAGPFTEEVLYRAASVPLMLISRASPRQIVLLTPLVFGLSHVHHFYEFRLSHPGVPAAAALARTLFQLAYTTLFGAYATFVYLRTGSLLAVVAAHAFCNAMGLPLLWGPVVPARGAGAGRRAGDDVAEERGREASRPWTAVYYALLVTGAVLFYLNIGRLTETDAALVQFAPPKAS